MHIPPPIAKNAAPYEIIVFLNDCLLLSTRPNEAMMNKGAAI